ncbi:MAG: ATP-binding cassette domain-containing protein [Gammaproteobacteria bacterium]|nr:ATP-binding cassette domain-containing protein [Gammaproteobacteria bacterium]
MALVTLRQVQLGFGGPLLLDDVSFSISDGERVCLLGRNGTGKSTLMKLIAGDLQPDDGGLAVRQGARIARLTQEVPEALNGPVFDVVAAGLGSLAELVRSYHHLAVRLETDPEEALLQQLADVQQQLEAAHGWQAEQRVESVLSRLQLDAESEFSTLSGGLKRRVLLARALVLEPDLLLLDEPTNHLDIESIDWLEQFLLGYSGALLFVTHDRAFLQRLATRIIELDRGRASDWPGDYANFLRRKEEVLNAEERANERFDKRLAEEEIWIRQGIKARRTRNEGRVRALQAMREERSRRREQQGQVRMSLQKTEQSGKLVVEAERIGYAWDEQAVVKDLSINIMRGDRIGVIGPNGIGKSTLLHLLLGRLEPDSGSVRFGTKLEVAYFDQLRAALDETRSVRDNLADGSDTVLVNGQPKHVISYLQDFLFTPDRARQPVKALSGGERNRLLLAKLFTKPANVLVMDEPTNDLDLETLELLEELLLEYTGTLLLVSHDRAFINSVVTSTLVFEGNGRVAEYVGGYDDWLRQRPVAGQTLSVKKPERKAVTEKPRAQSRKMGYKEQRELELLPEIIESLEQRLASLLSEIAAPGFYQQDGATISAVNRSVAAVESELAGSYRRWEELEQMQQTG